MALSWVVTVTTHGTAVQGPNTGLGDFLIKADPANTGYMYVGNDGAGDVADTNGYKLAAGDQVLYSGNANELYVDSSVDGEKVTILRVAGMVAW